jgi:hypothetical protein
LVQEPFVAGADTWIDRVVADVPGAERGFTLIFSSTPFPGHQYRLDWRRADLAGQLRIHDRGVIPLKRKEALGWAESKALDSDRIEEMFGKVAEAGDQTGAILLRVPHTLKLAIEKSAAVAGVSTNTWLMRCAERAIASEREQKANP